MNNLLFVEKYRPKEVDDCILPERLKKIFKEIETSGEIPNLLLSGSSGVGKTTIAKVLCDKMNCDWIMINGSEEGRKIDTLRYEVKNFASTVSLSGGKKVVILDEADYLNPESVQPALRGFMEEFSENCRFIFTCNFKNRILPALHSRCSVVDFTIHNGQKKEMAEAFFKRCQTILKKEKIKHDNKVLSQLIIKYFPDFRRVLNELQKYGASGEIDVGILSALSEFSFDGLVKLLKEKKFTEMRKWGVDNLDNDPSAVLRKLYDNMLSHLKPDSIPHAVLIIANYQYKSAFVADQEINLVACLTEMMAELEFK